MQPYFFPYIGYFQLINVVDRWVIFDDIQFIDKGWINRNRILHFDQNKEWQYITIPLDKRGRFDKICDVYIKTSEDWKSNFFGKLTSYRKAPYYKKTIKFLQDCFDVNEKNLSQFVARTIKMTANYLRIDTKIDVQSRMNISIQNVNHPGQWALRISELLGADEYINPCGGCEIFNEEEFRLSNIKLKFIKTIFRDYSQRRIQFFPGLSIIDVLMWNDLNLIKEMLVNDYLILTPIEAHKLLKEL